jgi:hypothetical protein
MTNIKASILLATLLSVHLADWALTVLLLRHTPGVEANPLMARLFAISPGAAIIPKLAVVLLVSVFYLGTHKSDRPTFLWLIALAALIAFPPVVWNLAQLAWAISSGIWRTP